MELIPGTMPSKKFYGYMSSIIGPRPICFASTIDKEGRPNLAPFSFFNAFGAIPPTVIFSPLRNGTTGDTKHTYQNIKDVPEVVINIVSHDIIQQVNLSSAPFEKGVNEFEKTGLTAIKSDIVRPFRVKEAPANIECRVNQVIEMSKEKRAGNLMICEILKIHIKDEILDENKKVDQHKIDLIARMGGNYYCRSKDALFEVTRPVNKVGVGVDQMPKNIRNSKYLTGNDLGKLGNVEALPNQNSISEFKQNELAEIFSNSKSEKEIETLLHQKAHHLLEGNEIQNAWKTLLSQ